MILLQDLSALDNGTDAVHEVASKVASDFRWYDAAGVTEMLIRFGFFMLVLFSSSISCITARHIAATISSPWSCSV